MSMFIPLSLDKKTWEVTKPLLFLNELYVLNLNEEDRVGLNYHLLCDYKTIRYEEIFEYVQPFVEELTLILEKELSQYHQIRYSHRYWHQLLFAWLEEYCAVKYYQTMLYVNIQQQFPNENFCTVIYEGDEIGILQSDSPIQSDDINYYARFAKVGERFFDLHVKRIKEKGNECTVEKQMPQHAVRGIQKSFLGKIFQKGIKEKILYRIFQNRSKSAVKVLYGNSYLRGLDSLQMIVKSHGKIQHMDLEYIPKIVQLDVSFRKYLTKKFSKIAINREIWEKVILSFLAEELSVTFIERYNQLHQVSMEYLRQYPKLKVIRFLNEMWHSDICPFCACLAKERLGIKLIGLQHGGNYGIIKNISFIEKNREDIFYGWGNWAANRGVEFKQGPSEKLYEYYKYDKKKFDYILFVGTWIPTKFGEFYFDVRNGKRYINWQIQFFKQLEKSTLNKIYVRNYYVDDGWGINKILKKEIHGIHFTSENENSDVWEVRGWDKEAEFYQLLSQCKLLICDHLSTTWLEALAANKPLMMFYPERWFLYEESEVQYIKMMEDVGILLHSPIEAAERLNQISENIDGWWNEPQRQAVVDIIKDRYISQEKDVVGWWVKELLRQSEEV